jgi:hypothetical protein
MRSDAELKRLALHAFANWLETGDILLSANDAIARKQQHIVKMRNDDGLREVLRLRELAEAEEI